MGIVMTIRGVLFHPLVAGPIGGGLVALAAYADAWYREVERERSTYIKLFIVSSLVITTLVYLVAEEVVRTDDFLNQKYDIELGASMMPKKGGFEVKKHYQMRGPQIADLVSDLPEVDALPTMPKSVFQPSSVGLKTERIRPRRH